MLDHPRTVLDLLDGQTAGTDWFRDRVSFRLGYTARRLLALASGELGRTEEAVTALLADREHLADCPLDAAWTRWPRTWIDPWASSRCCGEKPPEPRPHYPLADAEAEAKAGPPLPAHGWTLVLLARAAARLGDARRAAECFGLVSSLAAAGIDSCHPVILTAHYDEAMRCAALGDTGRAAKLLEPVLDRTVLAHGRPALSDAHPLLANARALAERLGIPCHTHRPASTRPPWTSTFRAG